MALTNERIKERLSEKFTDSLFDWAEPYGMLTFSGLKEINLKEIYE